MSGTEALARVLEASERFIASDGLPGWRSLTGGQMAERILADPGPLLAALAEAGVLTRHGAERRCQICGVTARRACYSPRCDGSGWRVRDIYAAEWAPADD